MFAVLEDLSLSKDYFPCQCTNQSWAECPDGICGVFHCHADCHGIAALVPVPDPEFPCLGNCEIENPPEILFNPCSQTILGPINATQNLYFNHGEVMTCPRGEDSRPPFIKYRNVEIKLYLSMFMITLGIITVVIYLAMWICRSESLENEFQMKKVKAKQAKKGNNGAESKGLLNDGSEVNLDDSEDEVVYDAVNNGLGGHKSGDEELANTAL